MNLAWRDVRHNLFRFVLTCLGLSLLMAVVLAMIGIYNGLVADALNVRGVPTIEIMSASDYRPHKLTPFARVDGTSITYPPDQASLF